MTSPVSPLFRIAGAVIEPTTPVLLNRPVHILTTLPVFGDARWDISAALSDRHSAGQALRWEIYPAPLRESAKLYAFALINVVDDVPRMPYSRDEIPHIKTIWGDLAKLRTFLRWLVDRGITAFDQVTVADLDAYLHHITDMETVSAGWKRTALLAVQRLHLYREVLPEHCRLPAAPLWGGTTAAQLAGDAGPWFSENRTHRIHPDVMQPLLSAALLVTTAIADDLLPVARRLLTMRQLAHEVAPPSRRAATRTGQANRYETNREHLELLLPALAKAGLPLPGRRIGRELAVDLPGLAVGGWLTFAVLDKLKTFTAETLSNSGLPIKQNFFRVTRFATVGTRPWRDRPVEAPELVNLVRHLTTACFLVIAYLSGVRTGEALNLRRGAISRDRKLDMIFMSGQQLKTTEDRRERSPRTIPWVVTEQTAGAVSVLEDLTVGTLLFPTSTFVSRERFTLGSTRSRTPGGINGNITEFIDWFNADIAPVTDHPTIGADPKGKIRAPRLRRTLAWHIVRRPGGTIAGATQYGHLHNKLIQGYAGRADSGFLDELAFEQFLQRAETVHDDHQRLARGEHISGPAAEEYRHRVADGSKFAGLAITTTSQVNNALANPALEIHHGALLTCVYRPATAACRDETAPDDGPSWPRCRLTCANAARTDRDIDEIRGHVRGLETDLAAPGLPEPLHRRIRERLHEHERAIAEHETTRPATRTTTEQDTR